MIFNRRHAGKTLLCAWASLLFGPLSGRLGLSGVRPVLRGQERAPRRREFIITASDYEFTPDRIEVAHEDIVKIELEGEDQPHGFAIDEYRILKRVLPDRTTAFEFRADRPGTFSYYCSISADPGCRAMRGTFVVRAKS
jgi:nitrous oxide reductase